MKSILMYSTGQLYTDRQTGGIKRFIELASYFSVKNNIETTLVSPDSKEIINYHSFKNFIQLNAPSSHKIFKYLPPEASILLSNLNTIKHIRKKKYSYIISFDVPPTIGLCLLGFNNIVLMIRKDMIGYERVALGKIRLTGLLKLTFQWICESICIFKAITIICQCDYDKRVLQKRHMLLSNLIEKKTKIQINNVNPSWITKSADQQRESFFTLNQTNFKICFIGNFDNPRKGHQLLLDTAVKFLEKHNNVDFILIGGGLAFESFKKKYEKEHIIFTGVQKEPVSILKECNLLVVPSHADSCPNTILEALYNEIPVIGSRAGGIPELLVDERSLFDLNMESLYSKIENCLDENYLNIIKKYQKQRKETLTFNWGASIFSLL